MCPLSIVFFSAFLAGVLVGGAVAVSAAMLAVGGPVASFAVIWGGGVMGSLAVIATFLAWRLTSSVCRSAERQG
jgi:ABC-type transport system involved in multi-copper enzyme maturation permease subunit